MAEEKDTSAVALGKEDKEASLSMVDVLEESEELEDEANAVLAGSDDKFCTYVQGAVKRQALYSCATCIKPDMEPAGVCLACSYECHEGHDLVEMYTKRNFTCDCGNDRFPNLKCKFFTNKAKTNTGNKYSDNFRGLYCICKRPYPDPEDPIEDEMIQCIMCEDWFHGRHLGTSPPVNMDYEEMVCKACMTRCDFLWAYAVSSVETKVIKDDMTESVDVECAASSTPETARQEETDGTSSSAVTNGKDATDGQKSGEETSKNEAETKEIIAPSSSADIEIEKTVEGESVEGSGCKLEDLKKRGVQSRDCATFWSTGWRKKLCTCDKCMGLYEEKKVTFLTELDDTVHHYEEHGKSKKEGTQYEQGIRALSSMDRVQQVEVMHGYNDMKTELKDYLKSFADQGKVVRAEDISEFFESMQARKRQRTDAGPKLPQHFCR